ncbi:MAG TPA: DNA-directed RNA polymerase subunit beta [Bacillales bacterium]|nr:DNA-directed RNA polymerase subunit beta [Bacillales bacterium]
MDWKRMIRLKKVNTEEAAAQAEVSMAEEPEAEDSRAERRRQKKRQKHRYRVRLIPIWLRLLIVLVLFAASLTVGAMVGYGVVGKGDPMDVFHKHTWVHIYNVVYKDVKK